MTYPSLACSLPSESLRESVRPALHSTLAEEQIHLHPRRQCYSPFCEELPARCGRSRGCPQRLTERRCADRRNHELLEIYVAVGMPPPVQHIELRVWEEGWRRLSTRAHIADARVLCRSMSYGQRDSENRIGAQSDLFGVPSSSQSLLSNVLSDRSPRNRGRRFGFRPRHWPAFKTPLPPYRALVAIAKFHCFAFPGKCSRRNFCRCPETIRSA